MWTLTTGLVLLCVPALSVGVFTHGLSVLAPRPGCGVLFGCQGSCLGGKHPFIHLLPAV